MCILAVGALTPPPLGGKMHLLQAVENLSVQAFFPEHAVEAPVITVLAGTIWFDKQRSGA